MGIGMSSGDTHELRERARRLRAAAGADGYLDWGRLTCCELVACAGASEDSSNQDVLRTLCPFELQSTRTRCARNWPEI